MTRSLLVLLLQLVELEGGWTLPPPPTHGER